jgi:hypothetical protein
MHSCEETPYTTRMQFPLTTSQTCTVLSNDDDARYWLLDVKSKSVMLLAYYIYTKKKKRFQDNKK